MLARELCRAVRGRHLLAYAAGMRMAWRVARAAIGAGLMRGGAWLLRWRGAGRIPLPSRVETIDEASGELPLLAYGSLVERTESGPLIELLRIKLGMPREVFDSAVRPVIEGYAQYVQLLPAVPARQTAPTLLLVHSLTTVLRALDYRRGQILPRGAPPEVIGAQMHRWSYAVLIAALLCDIDAAMNQLAVTMRCRDAGQVRWMPTSGAMQASGALRYRVERLEKAATATDSPGSLALLLLDRIVPPSVFAWLTAEPEPMGEMRGFLAGDETAGSGAIASIVIGARTGFGGASMPKAVRSACGPVTVASTSAARFERENVEQGEGEAIAQSPKALSGGAARRESASTPVIAEAPQAIASGTAESEFLDDFEEQHRFSNVLRSRNAIAGDADVSGTIGEVRRRAPVTLRLSGPSPAADRFMDWLQAGLANGSLPFNEQGAVVHFVPEGMLLVSPRVFREYAMRCEKDIRQGAVGLSEGNADIGKAIQLEVLRAGWHVRGRKGINILSYQVMRGEAPVSRLSGVVIRNPERFVTPVPSVNPLLIRLPADAPEA